MKILQNPVSYIKPQQKYINTTYTESKYVFTVTKNNYILKYNCFNDCCIVYDINTPPSEDFLISNWFLVDTKTNEFNFVKNIKTSIRNRAKNVQTSLKTFTIIPTTECNANCYYCFEFGARKLNMTLKIAEDTAKFIMQEANGQNIKLRWFGGEPLYNQVAIDTITSILYYNDINYTSEVITNGYLFNDLFIERYKEVWKMQNVQITLDGINDYYNKVKDYIYNDDKNPFETVLKNILLLTNNDIKVSIRLNASLDNYDELKETIDYIYKAVKNKQCISIHVAGIYELQQTNPKELFEVIKNLENYIEQVFKRKPVLKPSFKIFNCIADAPNSIVINALGKLTTCEHNLDCDIIGDVKTNINDTFNIREQYTELYFDENLCTNCSIFPMCKMLKKCQSFSSCNKEIKDYKIHKLTKKLNNTLNKYIKTL